MKTAHPIVRAFVRRPTLIASMLVGCLACVGMMVVGTKRGDLGITLFAISMFGTIANALHEICSMRTTQHAHKE